LHVRVLVADPSDALPYVRALSRVRIAAVPRSVALHAAPAAVPASLVVAAVLVAKPLDHYVREHERLRLANRMKFLSHPLYVEPLRDSREAVA
jgi:hypothetical protein